MKIKNFFSFFSSSLSLGGLVIFSRVWRKTRDVEANIQREGLQSSKADPFSSPAPLISIIIPARNEQEHIIFCLNAILAQDYPSFQVIVVDDNSTDQTTPLLTEFSKKHSRVLKVINCPPPGKNWSGKPNAIWQGVLQSDSASRFFLFLDADTRLFPGTLRAAISYAQKEELSLLSLAPTLITNSFWPALLIPVLGKFYALAAGRPLHPPRVDSVQAGAAGGAFILAEKGAYFACGGHQAVRNEVIEDVKLARLFREKGFKTAYTSGFSLLEKEPYQGLGDLWEGIGKNLALVAEGNWAGIGFIAAFEFFYGLVPFWNLLSFFTSIFKTPGQKFEKKKIILNLGPVILVYCLQARVNLSLKIPLKYVLLYPFSAVFSIILLFDSAFKTTFHRKIRWKGREISLT